MIKERCLLDLLEEEKKAVLDYNSLIDDCDFVTSHYTKISKRASKNERIFGYDVGEKSCLII